VRMCRRDREVPKDEAKPVSHRLLHLLDDRIRGPAVGALVVAVLHEGHVRVGRSLDVVAIVGYRQRECCLPLRPHEGSSSSARRIPSAPGLTPTGETKLPGMMPPGSISYQARSLVPSPFRYTP